MPVTESTLCPPGEAATDLPAGAERIRILHIVGHLTRGGIENWIYQTCTRMDAARFEHHVLVLTGADEPFTAEFRRAGFRVLPCPGLRRPHRFARSFLTLLKQNGPYKVLHCHGFSMLSIQALTLARLAGIGERILHGHNDLRPRLARAGKGYRLYVRLGLGVCRTMANRSVACGRGAAEWTFGTRGQLRSGGVHVFTGADLERCLKPPDPEVRERLGIPAGRFVLVQVGRFTAVKNQGFTLDVLHSLRLAKQPVHVLFLGDGPLRAGVRERAAAEGLDAHCTFIPDCEEVPEVLRSVAGLALMPSLNEGLPLAAVEAQAANVPLLLADTITDECVLGDGLAEFLPIDQGPRPWADRVLHHMAAGPRTMTDTHREQVLNSPFHLARSVERLTAIYESAAIERPA